MVSVYGGFRTIRVLTCHRIFDKCASVIRNFGSDHHRSSNAPIGWFGRNSQRNYCNCVKQPPCLRSELLCSVGEPALDGLNKVTVVGASSVGLACVNAILFQKISSHLALIDVFPKKLQGEGIDYEHGLSFLKDPKFEYDTDFCVSSNSKVVIIAIGARQAKNESRLDLLVRNAEAVKTIVQPLCELSPKAVFVVVTNPVDIISWLVWKVSGLPINRIIGSGNNLDTARFRRLIANRLGVASHSVHGYVVGEHGDSQVPLWSSVNVGGVTFREVLPNIGLPTDEEKWYEISEEVVNSAANVISLKGYTSTAIGLSVADLVKAILQNNQSVKCVSTLVQGHYNVCEETFLSLPCTLGERGVSNVVRVRMTEQEMKMFRSSAKEVFKAQKAVKL